ncbi:MAG: NUDIX domain-containing protein [Candidatus Saccharimonadales bacterium]
MIEHHIQRTIIERLTYADSLRFSKLKPDGMESNIFMYHLKQLIKDGYVEKKDTSYRLSSLGLTYVDGLSTTSQNPRQQPKLIAIIALHDAAGRWLLAERKTQPYIGTRMFISGKQHRGEDFTEHALRELREKTGLSTNLRQQGVANIQIHNQSGELLTHAAALVNVGEVASTALPTDSERFHFVWHDFTVDQAILMPGTREIYEKLRTPKPFGISLSLSE